MSQTAEFSRVIAGLATAALLSLLPQSVAAQVAFDWKANGERTYSTVCSACHQPNGQGLEGAFPPLAGHIADLAKAPNGRAYLARAVLYGVEGAITVHGKTYEGVMPPWNSLPDDQLAAALDYALYSWGNDKNLPADFKPLTPADIAVERKTQLTSLDVYGQRPIAGAAPSTAGAASGPSFTQAQAERGEAIYMKNCQDCHGGNLDDGEFGGAPLKGSWFRNHWGAGSVAALYAFTKTKMPPDRPGRLEDDVYADVVAFLLSQNGYAAGDKELPVAPEAQQQMSLKR